MIDPEAKMFLVGGEWDDVFRLPPTAFKVWMFHYRCERSSRESWPGEDTICEKLFICRDALFDARKWLKKYGWLVQTSGAHPGHNPTFRVERGTIPENASANYLHVGESAKKTGKNGNCVGKNASLNCRRQGSYSGSDSDFDFRSSSSSSSASVQDRNSGLTAAAAGNAGKHGGESQSQNRKTKTGNPKAAPDGTPYPDGFDSWSNAGRLFWLEAHTPGSEPPVAAQQDAQARQGGNQAERPAAAGRLPEPPGGAAPPVAAEYCDDCCAEPGHPHHKNCRIRLRAAKPEPKKFQLICTDCKKRPRGGAGYASLCVECFVKRMEHEIYKTGPKRKAVRATAQEVDDKDMREAINMPDDELVLENPEDL